MMQNEKVRPAPGAGQPPSPEYENKRQLAARLTLGFSKKLEHLKNSVALSIAHYNFCRVHHSLQGETPAMAARLTDHVSSIAELLSESGQVGSEKWICPLLERTVSPPIRVLKAA